MKTLVGLITIFVFLIAGTSAWAGDRVLDVQSRLATALSGILPKTDFMVIVNRIDVLDLASGTAASGVVRNLPGLRVGVDEEGQVVVKDGQGSAYTGAVSVTVVIDQAVKPETVRAIETLLPEIMGGARGGDEVKLKRAVLRQTVEEKTPEVVVNNMAPPADPDKSSSMDLVKVGALFFLGLGALLWLMSRKTEETSDRKRTPDSRARGEREPPQLRSERWDPAAFEGFDAEIVGLFILKCVHENDFNRARSYFAEATPIAQRQALAALPSWLASHCLERLELKENERDFKRINPETILRELTVMERSMKDDISAKASALIQWIPAEAMMKVHPESLAAPTDETRYAIISLRPDLARSFNYDENDALVSGMIFNAKAIIAAQKEMSAWKTRMVVPRNAKQTVVMAMAGIINRIESFVEIDVKLKSIQRKMSKLDWDAMQSKIVTRGTFDSLNELQRKDFLRLCDPADYFFIVDSLNVAYDWRIENLLRPKRLAAFRAAESLKSHEAWDDETKRQAQLRVLTHLRTVFLGEQTNANKPMAA